MNQEILKSLYLFKQLLARDLYIFEQTYTHRLKMSLYWTLLTLLTTKMFLPTMGLTDFAPFLLISSTISYGLFFAMQNSITFVEDILENQALFYELTLPIPQWAIFLKFAISSMIQSFVLSISILAIGYIFLMDLHIFSELSIFKLLFSFFCSAIFFGNFALILSSFLKNMYQIENVWLRIIFPLWYLGCWQFPWHVLYTINPVLAYLDLLNPLTLIHEAGRYATIDPIHSLPFYPSCLGILVYALICGIVGIYWLKKRLDCL
ncbi:MAG: ABC transporter permease [Silvanigrellaceae bacterium]|nr:ABC transporter permease [Silvanigrellaceae bacterium]